MSGGWGQRTGRRDIGSGDTGDEGAGHGVDGG